jgi:hypothetical protein
MQLRIKRPRHPVPERRSHKPARPLKPRTVPAPLDERRRLLQISERRLDRLLVALHQRARDRPLRHREQHTDALGRTEGQIQRRHPSLPLAQHISRPRIAPSDQRPELALPHSTLQPQARGAGADPPARRLPPARVIVIQAPGDLRLVVALLPGHQLPDRQHQPTVSRRTGAPIAPDYGAARD